MYSLSCLFSKLRVQSLGSKKVTLHCAGKPWGQPRRYSSQLKDLNIDPVYVDSQWSKADTLGVGEEETQRNLGQSKEEQFFLQLEVCLD